MCIGEKLGWLNTKIILAFIFYLIFLPTGLLIKMLGRDTMNRSFQSELKSYRIVSQSKNPKQLEKPY